MPENRQIKISFTVIWTWNSHFTLCSRKIPSLWGGKIEVIHVWNSNSFAWKWKYWGQALGWNILLIFSHTSYFTHFSLANHYEEILIFDCWSLVMMCKGMCLHCSFLLYFELHSLQLCHCTGLVCGPGKQEKLQGMSEAVSSMFPPWQYTLSLLIPQSISTLIYLSLAGKS